MAQSRCYGCMKLKNSHPVCEHCGYDETVPSEAHQLPAGTVLQNQYLIGRVLGQGGFGITYLGWDLYLDTPIAVKEYYPNGFVNRETSLSLNVTSYSGIVGEQFLSGRDRFLREAKSLARFSDVPEIVHVRNFFQANNTAYIVMEYIDGITLKQYVRSRGGRLSAQETLSILQPVMEALSIVHNGGLVHRDISPDNIMMLPRGRAKLLDFGAARDVNDADANRELTKSTEAILKHGFAPIEQYQRRGSLGPWTDVYALCATIYYCLTGTVPPDAPERMMGEQELRWSDIPGLTPRQASALEQGMAPLPKHRLASVDALCRELFSQDSAPTPPAWSAVQTPPVQEEKPLYTAPVSNPGPSYTVPLTGETPAYTAPVTYSGPSGRTEPAPEPAAVPTQKKAKKKPLAAIAAIVILVLATIGWAAENSGKKTAAPSGSGDSLVEVDLPAFTTPAVTSNDTRADWENNLLMPVSILIFDFEELGSCPAFGSNIPRSQILSVTFLDTLEDAPSSKWDVSANQDGTVYAWTTNFGTDYYDLYIAADGGVNGALASEELFKGFRNLEAVYFNGCFHTDDAEDMSCMFYSCEKLQKVDFTGVNTANVTKMYSMFNWCQSLTALDLSSFDTAKVTDMSSMFNYCEALTQLDISSFNTALVEDMNFMFSNCDSMTTLDLRNFDTTSVTKMQSMFQCCTSLVSVDLSSFRTPNLTNISWMFDWCSSLVSVDLSSFDTSQVTKMNNTLSNCESLVNVKLGTFDTSSVTEYKNFMRSGGTVNGRPWEELFQ